jgi:clan AA aspartic protease
MGEVRVTVKLTNSTDEANARRGALPRDQIRVYEADALVDTGAVGTVAPVYVIHQLGLLPYDERVVEYADGRKEPVDVTEPAIISIDGRKTAEELLVLGDEVIIGQTVLEKMDLLVDCVNRRVVPNPAHPDQPVTKVK